MEIQKDKTYKVDHSRKGTFNLQVTDANPESEWVTGIIVEGEASALCKGNEKAKGEEITVRRCLCTFHDLSIPEQGRGQLTQRIKDKAKELFGEEISQTELRLYPYLLSIMQNAHRIDTQKVNNEERDIIARLEEKGLLTTDSYKMTMSKEFWDKANEIVYLGYVDTNK